MVRKVLIGNDHDLGRSDPSDNERKPGNVRPILQLSDDEQDSEQDETTTQIRPPTYVSLSSVPPPHSAMADEAADDPFDESLRDELPTLVYERPPAKPHDDHTLSVVFRDVHAQPARASSRPPDIKPQPASAESRLLPALLPPPTIIPRAPRTPSGLHAYPAPYNPGRVAPGQSGALAPYERSVANDSLRPVFFSTEHSRTVPPQAPRLWSGGSFRGDRWNAFFNARRALTVAALCAGLVGAILFFQEPDGELVIDIANQQCGPVDDVRIFVDDELRCTSSPCSITIASGGHTVRAEANGYPVTAAEAVLVHADVPTLHKVQVGASTKTGLEIRTEVEGHHLIIDGRSAGTLPKRVTGLAPGEHFIRIVDESGRTRFERKVIIEQDQLLLIDGLPADESPPPQEIASSPPSLPPSNVPATGNDAASNDSGFDTPSASNGSTASKSAAQDDSQSPSSKEARRSKPQEASAKGILRLTADPSALVVLDGQPLGHTPKRVTVSAGPHSLLFVHPTLGRTKATVTVKAGQTRNLQARF